MSQIIVNISPEGEVKVEAAQVTGQGCQALTNAIEQALGETKSDQTKPEFHQAAQTGQQAVQKV